MPPLMESERPDNIDSLASIRLDAINVNAPVNSDSESEGDFQDAPSQQPYNDNDDDDDRPPAFPSLNSAQRQSSSSAKTLSKAGALASILSSNPARPASNGLMPPPSGLAPPSTPSTGAKSSSGGGLMAPPSTSALTAPLGVGGASGATLGNQSKRKKVALAPGCSPLDWARLKSTTDLRGGVTTLQRVTPSELKKHNTREDAWSAFYGKVYNITPYLRFHPGGEDELLRVAGRDGTRLFALTHSWVNIDAMIDSAMVGIMTSE